MAEALLDLTARIHKDFRFDSKVTNVRTTTEEVFKKRRGFARTLRTCKSHACDLSISPLVM